MAGDPCSAKRAGRTKDPTGHRTGGPRVFVPRDPKPPPPTRDPSGHPSAPRPDLPAVLEAAFGRNPDGNTMDHPQAPQSVDGQGNMAWLGRTGRIPDSTEAIADHERQAECLEPKKETAPSG